MLAIIVTVFGILTVDHTEGKQILTAKCPKWRDHYTDLSLEGKAECKPCTLCKPGFRQVTHCTKVDDTHCEPCRRDTYSSSNAKRCHPCKHCRQGGKSRRKCTNIEKAQCECAKGKYYKKGKCIPCTECLPGTYVTSQCSLRRNTQCKECPEGKYYKKGKCIPCTECLPGTYVTSQCSLRRDTQCKECQEGTYTTRTPNASHYCLQCSDCRLGEIIAHTCNSTHDTVCGECRPGMFRQSSTYECAPCSLCYPDVNGSYSNAIIIDECRRRNPDQSRICMPSVTTLPIYVSNSTDVETTVSSIADMNVMKTHVRWRFFEEDDEGLALFITACIVIVLACLVLFILCVAFLHRNAVKCGNICVKHQTTKQHVPRNLLEEYLVEQRSSQSCYLTRSNSANLQCTKTNSKQSRGTTMSLETGILHYFTEKEFYPPVTWTIGAGSRSVSLYSEMFSVSTTGTL
ncbi:tumor necrosis factor receptor superfamily member 11B-like isoform X2 [Mizuhopecten yessoensis]|uniref:Tumor necrosis factor receptor superfamily member 5 n=1 Tax=Mizuhopecten yessoensis TaxID=6573 RepID=A0A210QQZ9_MIZYE|nr:tumor necrosis factor receptor superfamily member 11B-like isoform X2 [Mizuhopecten yessoensis]OWF51139.1 Tumor necrosis factor receptor superfamily member 5 [Mizuhopecten yessoensis]